MRAPAQGWTLGGPPRDYVLGHVRAVLPDRVLDDALVAVRDGGIAEVAPHPGGVEADVDGQGMLCLPGLVDVHSDGPEKELLPRPGAELPLECALLSFEGKLRAAGVTTAYHGAAFEESGGRGMRRTLENARRIRAAVASRGDDGLVTTGSCTGWTSAARRGWPGCRSGWSGSVAPGADRSWCRTRTTPRARGSTRTAATTSGISSAPAGSPRTRPAPTWTG
ncbi:hypothetical protein [Streptomyces asiaticus]|uniref:hypothetical protein n=1 Tax=Streptomyces asiaticus TaxID=114695 RepID=UPI0037F6464A